MADPQIRLEERPIPVLIGNLIGRFGVLISGEVAIAREEFASKARGIVVAGLCAALAAAFGIFAGVAALITVIALLRIVLPLWAAALITAGFLFALTAVFALAAKASIVRILPLIPERTAASLRENSQWLKTLIRPNP